MGKKVILIVVAVLLSGCPLRACEGRVLFDTSHDSYPMNQGEMDECASFLEGRGFKVVRGGLEELSSYSLIVITTPGRPFSEAEVSMLGSYVTGGGTLFVGGQADYKNNDRSEILNALLKGMGSTMSFNDDEAVDEKESCGARWCVVSHSIADHALTRGIRSLSFYSSQTILPGDALRLAAGNTTTSSEDTDMNGDATDVSGGGITLLALEGMGEGYLIASGAWHLLDNFNFTKRPETVTLAGNIEAFTCASLPPPPHSSTLESALRQFARTAIFVGEPLAHGTMAPARDEVDMAGAQRLAQILGIQTILRDSQAKNHTGDMILVGGPAVNALTDAITPYLPIPFGNDGSWYLSRNGEKYYGSEYGVVALIEVSGRKICVVAGVGGTGTAGAIKIVQEGGFFDPALAARNEYGQAFLVRVTGDENWDGMEGEPWTVEIV